MRPRRGPPVALWTHHAVTALAGRLLAEEHLTLLLPLRAGVRQPGRLAPACKDGRVLLFGARRTAPMAGVRTVPDPFRLAAPPRGLTPPAPEPRPP
ncbi:hypothetical protein [Streptomyces goshikiensis]|uniref:hypothetical protein n=1 Tax=Streptomyces goshikiensis TaxID=1942 RepID=UPI00369BE156